MALRPLMPKSPKEAIADGWDLLATEAGRSGSGLRATLMVLNGEPKATHTLLLGHTRRTAFVVRTVGDDHEPRKFSTWAPKMLAGIGKLPDTIRDRSILLKMMRKKPSEAVTKWREREAAQFLDLRRRCVRWAADTSEAIAAADPEVPDTLSDRAADNWATLLAIANQAGGAWPQRARDAISVLEGASAISSQVFGNVLHSGA